MCNKNCGSGGDTRCTCQCKEVIAYKSKNGSLYETKKDCQKADETWDKEQERKRKEAIEQQAKNAIYGVVNYTKYFPGYYDGYRDNYREWSERGYASALQDLSGRWRELRSLLNAIQE